MNRKPNSAGLRHRAEARLRQRKRDQRSEAADRRSEANTRRLLHELQVHQVELEMQNEELKESRDRMEALLEKYTDLYDSAPIGYFSLDDQGRILEVNLTGATLLGVERSRLINRRLTRFVAPPNRQVFLTFLEQVLTGPEKQVCEATLLKEDGTFFWADFHGRSDVSISSSRKSCRVMVSDITALKRAEEAQQRLGALALANRNLKREIVQRQAVQEALKKSEQHQTRLLEQSRQMQVQLRHLSHQMLQAQEEERKRISRELHDEIAQTLVGINVHLEALVGEVKINPNRFKQKIARTQRLVEKSVNIVQKFSRELRPTLLDDLGLIAGVHSFMKDFARQTGIHAHLATSAGVEQLDSTRSTVIYRVVQSALTNAAQHAQAGRVNVSIRKLAKTVHLEINDDGKSFEVERVLFNKKNQHLGLLGMRERVEMVGGNFSVESAPHQGTTIRAQVPFRSRRARRRC